MSKEREIFEVAIEIDDLEARRAFVDQSCHDEALRRRVHDLLNFETEEKSFLSEEQLSTSRLKNKSLVGRQIDRYKLLEEIGEGGCGIVYMAEQRTPVHRKVALKIVKPGMDTREVVARFEAERQALALMDHPNIARVLDGGETTQGRPYFVMELVNGVPITEFCDANRLTLHQRLQLFIKVCHAIQHAHQKGIIHRDIKPSNVLVTLHDGESVPRVIDFGVAKALGTELTDRTLFTRHGQIVGTPQYMSPEQAERSGVDVDTRSDIYSLGVLLYELLTGQTPLDKSRLKEAALDEVLRIVREEEPPTPSRRISTLGTQGTIIAHHRSIEPLRFHKLLQGDLDWIVIRALEKDRKRRFEHVGEFIADIQRHMSDQPVMSRPPSAAYRAAKFVRRNRLGVIATTVVIGSLVAGLAFAIVGFSQANRERQNAITSAADAQTMLTLLRYMLETNPNTGRGRDLTVRQMLDQFGESLRDLETENSPDNKKLWVRGHEGDLRVFRASFPDLAKQPQVAAEIHNILGNSYQGLDLYEEALFHFHREYDISRETYGKKHPRTALAANYIAHLHDVEDNHVLAQKYGDIAVSILDELGDYSQASVHPRSRHGERLAKLGEPDRGEEILRRTIREVEKRYKQLPDADGALISLRGPLATCLSAQGNHEAALSLGKSVLEKALEYNARTGKESSGAHARIRYGDLLVEAGQIAESLLQFEQAMDLVKDHEPSSLAFTRSATRCAVANSKLFQFGQALSYWDSFDYLNVPHEKITVFLHVVFDELNQGNIKGAVGRCQKALEFAGDSPKLFPLHTVAKFMAAFSLSQHEPEEYRSLFDELCDEANTLANSRKESFSHLHAWVLLHKSDPTGADIDMATQRANDAITLTTHIHAQQFVALAHHTLAKAQAAANTIKPDDDLLSQAITQQKLAIARMPAHQLFLRALLDEQMVDFLNKANRTEEARQFLRQAVESRVREKVPEDNMFLADARMRLAEHLIRHTLKVDDFAEAEKLLEDEIESLSSNDILRTRRQSLWDALDEARMAFAIQE